MLIIVLIAFGGGALAAGVMLAALWSAIPRSNADFEWLDV